MAHIQFFNGYSIFWYILHFFAAYLKTHDIYYISDIFGVKLRLINDFPNMHKTILEMYTYTRHVYNTYYSHKCLFDSH